MLLVTLAAIGAAAVACCRGVRRPIRRAVADLRRPARARQRVCGERELAADSRTSTRCRRPGVRQIVTTAPVPDPAQLESRPSATSPGPTPNHAHRARMMRSAAERCCRGPGTCSTIRRSHRRPRSSTPRFAGTPAPTRITCGIGGKATDHADAHKKHRAVAATIRAQAIAAPGAEGLRTRSPSRAAKFCPATGATAIPSATTGRKHACRTRSPIPNPPARRRRTDGSRCRRSAGGRHQREFGARRQGRL